MYNNVDYTKAGDILVLQDEETQKWYALFVATGEEENVRQRLEYRFKEKFDIFIPRRRLRERVFGSWKFVVRSLFPGYVLLSGSVCVEDYYAMKTVPGIIRLLRSDFGLVPIRPEEIFVLRRLICNGETIGISNVLVENQRIRVVDGPLVDLEGLVQSVNYRKGRATVRLSFLGEDRAVDLGISVIQPA